MAPNEPTQKQNAVKRSQFSTYVLLTYLLNLRPTKVALAGADIRSLWYQYCRIELKHYISASVKKIFVIASYLTTCVFDDCPRQDNGAGFDSD
jgi:hypothetical protein